MNGIERLRKGDMLPSGNNLTEKYTGKEEWAIWQTQMGSVLCVNTRLHQLWSDRGLIEPGIFLPVSEDVFLCEDVNFGLISSSAHGPYPRSGQEASAIAAAFEKTRRMFGSVCLASSFFIPGLPCVLPGGERDDSSQDSWTLGRWLTGGMNVPFTDRARILRWVPGMTELLYSEILDRFGWEETKPERIQAMPMPADPAGPLREAARSKRQEGPFSLPGRPELEKYFRERILDVIDREAAYRRMGIGFPGPTLLVGPPGCGKTYAVEKLTEYLGWPCYQVNAGSIGSSYLHETSRLISELFQKAMSDAPSVVIMDEMEAYLSARSDSRGINQYHTEEMAEFLRILPQLSEKKVLLFGMTNMPDQIDPAIRRKGRFDHVLELKAPSKKEVVDLLDALLRDVPKEANLNLDRIAASLSGRPISDIAYVAKEAGRLCVVGGQDRINERFLDQACKELEREKKDGQSKRSIGFE